MEDPELFQGGNGGRGSGLDEEKKKKEEEVRENKNLI